MRARIVVSGFLLAAFAGEPLANCTGGTLITDAAALTALFSGSLVCARPGANYAGVGGPLSTDRWQEQHRTDGTIWDHKKGIGDPIDPEKQVGTWRISTTANTPLPVATYIEDNGSPATTYVYQLRLISGNTYSFCLSPTFTSEQVVANIIAGQGSSGHGCPGYP